MQRWEEIEPWLVEEAERDLRAGDDAARPCLAAYRGEEPLFVAFLRQFAKGRYHDALIELLALAAPLRADRLAFSVTGRAWSLDDPIPPVTDGVDLRQQVLMVESADSSTGRVVSRSLLIPFDRSPGRGVITWGERQVHAGGCGWIPGALRMAVGREMHLRMEAHHADVVGQAVRVQRLGHLLAVGPGLAQRLDEARRGRPPV